jgi:hypothetical protein
MRDFVERHDLPPGIPVTPGECEDARNDGSESINVAAEGDFAHLI